MTYIDPMADPERPHMARGTHVLGGVVFVVTPHLPLEHVTTEIKPRPAVLRWLWLLRWVPRRWRPAWYRIGERVEQEQFILAAGKVFCTPAGYHHIMTAWQRIAR